eukprot:CAMPEP_0170115042 /NCGR_PEP_ID=MMETSP0020_2-20130122/11168_1 /TAXON_ID=98059 /ORGANISM="Dinobryon sp., Strain UTEXLB2267" /LENGTH=264 /DNA_ID=CAMNT_0010342353 /DNA_START=313 /DNA_END=1107 /DNA_ORIENTATION=-
MNENDSNPNVIIGGLLDMFVYSVIIRFHTPDNGTKYFVSERVHEPRAYIVCLLLNLFGLPLEDIGLLLNRCSANETQFFIPVEYDEMNYERVDTALHEKLGNISLATDNEELPMSSSSSILPTTAAVPALKPTTKKSKAKKRTPDPSNKILHNNDKNDGKDMKLPSQNLSHIQGRVGVTTRSQAALAAVAANKQQQKKNKHNRVILPISEEELDYHHEKVRELVHWDTRRLGFIPLTESELNKRNMASRGVNCSGLILNRNLLR